MIVCQSEKEVSLDDFFPLLFAGVINTSHQKKGEEHLCLRVLSDHGQIEASPIVELSAALGEDSEATPDKISSQDSRCSSFRTECEDDT